MNERVVHFTDLKVWQKAHKVFLDFTDDVKELPNSIVNREIIRQLIRSIGSISANISEGFNSQSTKEYLRFLDIARRSTAESENWFYKLRDLKTLDRKKVD